jgi:molybdenum cofactor cytidylyltransferase
MPAAGLSTRMGAWKLMLPYNDETILEASVKNALAICSRVILIAGYRSDELIEKMSAYSNVSIVLNKDYQQGMLSSIKLGIEHVSSDYFFIAHADMPCINSELYHQLWQARGAGSIFPGDEQHSGHPVLINASLKQLIANDIESKAMKGILKKHPMTYLQLANSEIHFDIDTPETYEKLCESL